MILRLKIEGRNISMRAEGWSPAVDAKLSENPLYPYSSDITLAQGPVAHIARRSAGLIVVPQGEHLDEGWWTSEFGTVSQAVDAYHAIFGALHGWAREMGLSSEEFDIRGEM